MHVGTDGTDRPVATVAGYDHRSPTEYNAPATPQVGSRDGSVSYKAPASGSASRQLTINRPDITASTNHLLQSLGRQDQLPFSASASPARASSPFGSSRSGPSGNDSNLHEVRVDRGVPHKDSPLSAPVTGPPGYPARRNDQREGARSPKSATSAPSKFGALKLKAWPGSKGSKDLKDEKSDLPGGLPPKGQVSDKSSASSLQNNLQNGLQGLQKLKFWQANPSAELDATQRRRHCSHNLQRNLTDECRCRYSRADHPSHVSHESADCHQQWRDRLYIASTSKIISSEHEVGD